MRTKTNVKVNPAITVAEKKDRAYKLKVKRESSNGSTLKKVNGIVYDPPLKDCIRPITPEEFYKTEIRLLRIHQNIHTYIQT